jgi:hypothetical protein
MEETPPFSLIVSGLEPTLQLLDYDEALARRSQKVRIDRVHAREHKPLGRAIFSRAADRGLKFEPDHDLIERLVHAANHQFGLALELAWHAIDRAERAGSKELDTSHFAEAYFRRTNCASGLNVFEASDWGRIDTTAILPKLVDDVSQSVRSRR